jgi:hypothetical protein
LRKTIIPDTDRHFYYRDGSCAFCLAHMTLWWHEEIEPIDKEKLWDDWGWAVRPVRGQTSGYSNHSSGTAGDVNAVQHPRGVSTIKTFTIAQIKKIRARLHFYDEVIRWGGDYQTTPDGMHLEINEELDLVEKKARELLDSPRGKRILEANPGLKQVILS